MGVKSRGQNQVGSKDSEWQRGTSAKGYKPVNLKMDGTFLWKISVSMSQDLLLIRESYREPRTRCQEDERESPLQKSHNKRLSARPEALSTEQKNFPQKRCKFRQ